MILLKKRFDSLLEKYQKGLEENMINSIGALYYKLHKASINRGGSYIDSPEWLKNKQATINPINKKMINAFIMQ